ncbi:MAG: heptaprenyl diphosphate synthase component 1 [Tumebacillaceae bacterium]
MLQVQQRADLDLRVQDISSKIHVEMGHSYLSKVLQRPELEQLQLVLAQAMVRAAGLAKSEAETVVSTMMLIYHGLAVHEEIDTLAAHADERYRQLGVLAGDYYSSKYYRLLAEAGLIHLIGTFARAIQVINEAKAELERDTSDYGIQIERYLEMQETIHGTLLHALRETYLPGQALWEELVTLLVRATVLVKELGKNSTQVWSRTLTNLMVWQQASGEERKWLKQMKAGKGPEHRLLSLHVKYGTSSEVYQQVDDLVGIVQQTVAICDLPLTEVEGLCEKLIEYRPAPSLVCEEG